jgi:hypothetical protein
MSTERDQEMQAAISNMLSDLGMKIKEPLTESNQREIFKTIYHCLIHLSENKQNTTESR